MSTKLDHQLSGILAKQVDRLTELDVADYLKLVE